MATSGPLIHLSIFFCVCECVCSFSERGIKDELVEYMYLSLSVIYCPVRALHSCGVVRSSDCSVCQFVCLSAPK